MWPRQPAWLAKDRNCDLLRLLLNTGSPQAPGEAAPSQCHAGPEYSIAGRAESQQDRDHTWAEPQSGPDGRESGTNPDARQNGGDDTGRSIKHGSFRVVAPPAPRAERTPHSRWDGSSCGPEARANGSRGTDDFAA